MPLEQRGKSYDELLKTIQARDTQLREKQILVEAMRLRQNRYMTDLAQAQSDRDAAVIRTMTTGKEYDIMRADHRALIEAREMAEYESDDAEAAEHKSSRLYEAPRATIRRLARERDEARRQNGAKSGELFRLSAEVNELKKQLVGSRDASKRVAYARDQAWAELGDLQRGLNAAMAKAGRALVAYDQIRTGCACYCPCIRFSGHDWRNCPCDKH